MTDTKPLERALIGAALHPVQPVPGLPSLLDPSDFHEVAHERVWEAVQAVAAQGLTPDPLTVSERLKATGEERHASVADLAGMTTEATPNPEFVAGQVRDAATRRRIAAQVTATLAQLGTGTPLADVAATLSAAAELAACDDPAERSGRRVRVTRACDIPMRRPVFAWEDQGEGRLPAGALAIAAGREGTGKSSFGIWLAAHLTRGTLPGVFHGTPRGVFYVATEDSWTHTLGPRLEAAGADRSLVYRVDVEDITAGRETVLSLPRDTRGLGRAITAHDAALVILDPLMSVMGDGVDVNQTRDVRAALEPLVRVAEDTGAVVLGIAHFNKSSGTDVSSLITGSGAFKDLPRAVFGFARDDADEDGGRVMTQSKNSLARDDLPSLGYRLDSVTVETADGPADVGRFTFTGPAERTVSDILRSSSRGSDEDDEARDEVATWLHDHLATNGGSMPSKDVYKAGKDEGYSTDMLKRAKRRAGVRSTKPGMSTGWYWQLDEATTTNTEESA